MSEWFCRADETDAVSGPYTWEELRFLGGQGKLRPEHQIRESPRGSWVSASSLASSLFVGSAERRATYVNGKVRQRPRQVAAPIETPAPAPVSVPPLPEINEEAPEDDRRKRIIIGTTIGTVLALLLLLLFWLRSGDVGGSLGETAGSGAGNQQGVGAGTGVAGADHGNLADGQSAAGHQSSSQANAGQSNQEPSQDAGEDDAPIEASESTDVGLNTVAALPPAGSASAAAPSGMTGGGLGDIDNRLIREGAKSGDVQITLAWNNRNDLDLHVICPSDERISFEHRKSACGGELDVDMNHDRFSDKPIENVYWPTGGAPKGRYQIYVDEYANNGGSDPTAFQLLVKVGGKMETITGRVKEAGGPQKIHQFTR